MSSSFHNITGYKFVTIEDPHALKAAWLPECRELGLIGTILLAHEGINVFLAGSDEATQGFRALVAKDERFADLEFKESWSDQKPFNRMLIKVKKEIISMGVPEIDPSKHEPKYIEPLELKRWYDEGKSFRILDTRNDYEIRIGTFKNAEHLDLQTFRAFPEAARAIPAEHKSEPVVTFCTGGIRCAKAAPLLESYGFEEVYELKGGILKYFEDCGAAFWDGECFVFDHRVAVDGSLAETDTVVCYRCRAPLTKAQVAEGPYAVDEYCLYCVDKHGSSAAS